MADIVDAQIWDEPEATLKPGQPHDLERRTVAAILYGSFRLDSTLMTFVSLNKAPLLIFAHALYLPLQRSRQT